jgi:transposase-like protein
MKTDQEKPIKAYRLKDNSLVCPACASDEERKVKGPDILYEEDVIHDDNPEFSCARCEKKIK